MIPVQAPYPEGKAVPVTAPAPPLEAASLAAVARPLEALDEESAGRQRLVLRLRSFWQRRAVVRRATCAGFLVSALAAIVIPWRYQSVTRLMPPDQANPSAGLALLAASSNGAGASLGSLAGGILGLKSSGDLFVGILQSRTVQDNLVREFQLQKVYRDRYTEDARSDLMKNSEIYQDRKSGIITVEVTDSDPLRAAAIARGYTQELNTVINQMSTSSARREREFLEERLKAVQAGLGEAEKDWSDFASKNGAVDIQIQSKAMIEGAATLQGQLIAAESELQGLKQVYTDDNVRIRSTRAQIQELKSQLDKIGGVTGGAGVHAAALSGDLPYPTIRKLPGLGVSYADLYRNTKVQEAVFETLTREYELAKVQEVKETPSVKVLDPASVPEKKSFPPRILIIAVGTFMGFLAGMVYLLLRTLWDETDPGDPRREFALEVYQSTASRLSWHVLTAGFTNLASRASWGRGNGRREASAEHD